MSTPDSSHQNHPQTYRRLRIHAMLSESKYPNCSTLGRALEISAKTVQREIDFMRDVDRMPIEYDSSRKGFYYTEAVTKFPEVKISEGELVALLIAQKALEQYRGTPLEKRLTASFAKITAQLRDDITFDANEIFSGISFRSVGTTSTSIKIFEALASGLRKGHAVAISYRKAEEEAPSSRIVHPYHLACIQSSWYLVAFDSKSSEVRKFALTRIRSAKPTTQRFVRPKTFSAESYFKNSFGVFTGGTIVEVEIEFDSFVSGIVREREWHGSQTFTRMGDGRLRLKLKVSRLEEVKNWVLSWGRHAKVIAPPEFAVEIKAEALAMSKL